MFVLETEFAQQLEDLVYVQEEPPQDLVLPQVFTLPPLTTLHRGQLPHVEGLVAKICRAHRADPTSPLGQDYQHLVNEFQPFFLWLQACWDYLLSTEGCRFVPRALDHKWGVRGDYRAFTSDDYSRMVRRLFRHAVLGFMGQPATPTFGLWLREHFWPLVVEEYQQLEAPPDPRQRRLTPYSYLRCVPYQFLNPYHHELVEITMRQLDEPARQAITYYFLHFYTEPASAEQLACSIEECQRRLRQGLTNLLIHHRLVYCLLRQIERY